MLILSVREVGSLCFQLQPGSGLYCQITKFAFYSSICDYNMSDESSGANAAQTSAVLLENAVQKIRDPYFLLHCTVCSCSL